MAPNWLGNSVKSLCNCVKDTKYKSRTKSSPYGYRTGTAYTNIFQSPGNTFNEKKKKKKASYCHGQSTLKTCRFTTLALTPSIQTCYTTREMQKSVHRPNWRSLLLITRKKSSWNRLCTFNGPCDTSFLAVSHAG